MAKFGELIDSKVPVLIYFYVTWMEECNRQQIVVNDIASEYGDKLKIVTINVDQNQVLALALNIKAMPTIMLYKHSETMFRHSGRITFEKLCEVINTNL